MILQVNYTENDFREANAAARSLGWLSVSTLPFFYLFVAYLTGSVVGQLLQRPAPGAPPKGPIDVCVSTFPLMLVAAYWGFVVFRTGGRRSPHFLVRPPRLSGTGVLLPAALAVVTFAVTACALAFTPPPPPEANPPAQVPLAQTLLTLALGLAPMVVMLVCAGVMTLRLFRRNIVRVWELQTHLHQIVTVEVDEGGVVVSDPACHTRYLWGAFVGWHETPGVFVLYRSYASFEMIPKRSFPTPAACDYFYALIRRQIGERVRGFDPVQSLSPPAAS
jgi:hypothetical protein